MKYQIIPAPPELSDHVKFYWSLEAEIAEDKELPHRLFADACPTIVFHYRNTFKSASDQSPGNYPLSILHGHTREYADMSVKGSFGIFGIYLNPLSIGFLFDTTPGHLMDSVVSLPDLLGREGIELEERMITCKNNGERIRIANGFLRSRVHRVRREDKMMSACVDEFINTKGNTSIGYLAENSGWSVRHLERRFDQALGLSPKLYSRILRFQNTIINFERGNLNSLSELAYASGFFDQSHLIREFRSFSGLSPKEYFKYSPEIAEGFAQLP